MADTLFLPLRSQEVTAAVSAVRSEAGIQPYGYSISTQADVPAV